MKRLILVAFALLTCLVGRAQYRDSENLWERLDWDDSKLHILLDTRFDFLYGTGTGADQRQFNGQSLRLWLEGEIVPGIRYRLRHKLNRPQTPALDNLSDATDHMWIAFDIGKKRAWTITVGKQSVQLGTFEYDYNPADNYLSTQVNSGFDGHKIGVNAAWKFLGQTLNLQVFSPVSAQFTDADYRSKAMGGSVMWAGSLFKGALKTRTGYTVLQRSSKKTYDWFTTGWQVNAGGFTAEADYYLGGYNVDYATGGLGMREVRDQSAALNLRYGWKHWYPSVKGIWDNRRDTQSGSDVFQRFGVQAAVELYPFKGHKWVGDLRFHLVYSFTTTGYKGVFRETPRVNRHQILAGVRWFFVAK